MTDIVTRRMKALNCLSDADAALRLSEWYKVGDRPYFNGLPAKCDPGVIVGFGKKYVQRGRLSHQYNGTYIDFLSCRLATNGGEIWVTTSSNDYHRDATSARRLHQDVGRIFTRTGPLPMSEFWEGDRVRLRSVSPSADPEGWVVEHVRYDDFLPSSGTLYTLTSKPSEGQSLRLTKRTEDLELIERGNIWKLENGRPLDLPIEEEAKLHQTLGLSTLVENDHGSQEWLFNEARQLIAQCRGHELKIKNKVAPTFLVVHYDRADFAKRMRAQTMSKWEIEDPKDAT